MEERDCDRPSDPDDANGSPPDRRVRDGVVGAGDMLGGLGAGAGDRLGPDADDAFDPANQHRFGDMDSATDTAENDHGRDDPT
jgi:hypothetical protein